MFKKFTKDEHVSAFNQVKSSVQRGIRAKIGEQYPYLEDNDLLDELIPKKEPMIIAKWCAICPLAQVIEAARRSLMWPLSHALPRRAM
mmetsp:Transcript_17528/g.56523  ORF Transcript_17528/g.56523 Transcript_17528/m.56523 type:complete len:88 (-) Transcript_17528:499-762(-)